MQPLFPRGKGLVIKTVTGKRASAVTFSFESLTLQGGDAVNHPKAFVLNWEATSLARSKLTSATPTSSTFFFR